MRTHAWRSTGRKVNTITVDDERVRYVVMAFELMASGTYNNVEDVQAALTDAGLRMSKTGQPISKQIVFRMLRDRYYIGYVNHKGIEYQGRHQPLISEELFNRVQRVLDSHSGSGVRRRVHHHYLKGLLWCERCRARFILQRAKGRLGGEYFYSSVAADKTTSAIIRLCLSKPWNKQSNSTTPQ